MAETTEIVNPGEDNPSPFAPSLMSQAKSLLGGPSDTAPSSPPIEYKPEDLEGIFSMPFDAAAFITKLPDLELSKKELEQLTRIWSKPMAKLAERYPTFPWVIAGTLTMGIITEKVLIFYIAREEKRQQEKKMYDEAHRTPASKAEELEKAALSNARG